MNGQRRSNFVPEIWLRIGVKEGQWCVLVAFGLGPHWIEENGVMAVLCGPVASQDEIRREFHVNTTMSSLGIKNEATHYSEQLHPLNPPQYIGYSDYIHHHTIRIIDVQLPKVILQILISIYSPVSPNPFALSLSPHLNTQNAKSQASNPNSLFLLNASSSASSSPSNQTS